MADIAEQAKALIPHINMSSVTLVMISVIMIIVIGGIIGFFVYLIYMRKKFNKKILVWGKVGNVPKIVMRDTGAIVRIGNAGDMMLITRKSNKALPPPTIQAEDNSYWYAIRGDDEWINIGLDDIDIISKKMKIQFTDREMRLARLALLKNLEQQFKKVTFWDKYGGIIVFTSMVIIICVFQYLLFDKYTKVSTALGTAIEASGKLLEHADKIIGTLDRLCSTGGIRPV